MDNGEQEHGAGEPVPGTGALAGDDEPAASPPTAEVPTVPTAPLGAPGAETPGPPGTPGAGAPTPGGWGPGPWGPGAAGAGPWAGAAWGPGPWGAVLPPGWGAPPWGWYGPWMGQPGGAGPVPPRPAGGPPRRPTRPWTVAAFVAATLALMGIGVGIGYAVWGTQTTAAQAATSGAALRRPGIGVAPVRGAFLGVEIGPRPARAGGATAGTTGGSTAGSGSSSKPAGAYVLRVVAGSPAAGAGITRGDTITGIGGKRVRGAVTLSFDVGQDSAGQRVSISWTTPSGAHHSATVTLATRATAR